MSALIDLPPKVLVLIAEKLPLSSLRNLCVANSRLLAVLTPVLYSHAIKDDNAPTVLYSAAVAANLPLVRYILANATGLTVRIKKDLFEKVKASPLGHTEALAENLVVPGVADQVSIFDTTHQRTPMHWACRFGYLERVKKLLEAAAEADNALARTTPAAMANTANRDDTVVSVGSKRGKVVNAIDIRRGTPLMWAAWNGNEDLIKLLLEHGADHTAKDAAGMRARHYALSKGHNRAFEILDALWKTVRPKPTTEQKKPGLSLSVLHIGDKKKERRERNEARAVSGRVLRSRITIIGN